MILVQDLTKYYGRKPKSPAVESVSFEVKDGEIVGFVGLNGAGKTTTIRICVGVSLPSSGSVIIDGKDIVEQKSDASRHIGWVPEFPNYEQNAKARDLLLYFAGFREMPDALAKSRADELLNRVGLAGFEEKRLRTFSQGMKKRFSLALALLPDPKNFLFDEILNGLDPQGIHYMRLLLEEQKKMGKAVLLSSHILSEIEMMSDRVVFIHQGKIIKALTREELSSIEAGGASLRIVIQNLNDAFLGYLRTLGEVRFVEQNVLNLSNFNVDPAAVNTELVKRGALVREFSIEKSNLEEYFFKLVGANDGSHSVTGAAG